MLDAWNIYNIIALILGIIGLIWFLRTIWRDIQINQHMKWPHVSANIVAVYAVPIGTSTRIELNDMNPNDKYTPRILYKYTVDNKTYESSNLIYDGPSSYSGIQIKNLLGTAKPGDSINVLYNPSDPAESYIYPGVVSYIGLIVGILLILVGAFIAYSQGWSDVKISSVNSVGKNNMTITTPFRLR